MGTQVVRNKTTKTYKKTVTRKATGNTKQVNLTGQKHPTVDCCVHKVHTK